jgi:hypothetical protein
VQLERRVLFLLLPRARSSGDGGWDVRPRGNISRGEAEESEGERERRVATSGEGGWESK